MSENNVELGDLLFSGIFLVILAAFAMVGVYKMTVNNMIHNNNIPSANGVSISTETQHPFRLPIPGGGGGGQSVYYVSHSMQYTYSWGDDIPIIGYFAGGGWLQMGASYGYFKSGSEYYFVPGSPWSVTAEATTANTNLQGLGGGTWDFSGAQNEFVTIPNTVYQITPTEISWENTTVNGVTVSEQTLQIDLTFQTAYFIHLSWESHAQIRMTLDANGQVFGEMWHNGNVVVNWKELIKQVTRIVTD